jgi:hypothetical protein
MYLVRMRLFVRSFLIAGVGAFGSFVGCASTPTCECVRPQPAPVTDLSCKKAEASNPPQLPSAEAPAPVVNAVPSASTSLPEERPPVVSGPVTGGPRGSRPCEFRESVDTYARTCLVTTEPDGTLRVTAKGTALNPENGFSFRMGGGPDAFSVAGELQAFGICKGPFGGKLVASTGPSGKSYEVRFKEHCKIVIR